MFYGKMTALHFTIAEGKTDLMHLLLENGADASLDTYPKWKTDGRHISSVQLAQRYGSDNSCSILTKKTRAKAETTQFRCNRAVGFESCSED